MIIIDPQELKEKYYKEGLKAAYTYYKMSPRTFYHFLERNNIPKKGWKNNGRPIQYKAKSNIINEKNC